MAKRRRCYLCGEWIKERYTFCVNCSKRYGMYKQPRAMWEQWALSLARLVDNDWYDYTHPKRKHVSLDSEKGQILVARQASACWRRDLYIMPLDVVLFKYNLSLDEYDLITEKPKTIAARMGVSRSTVYNRRKRIKKRILDEGILQQTLDERKERAARAAKVRER